HDIKFYYKILSPICPNKERLSATRDEGRFFRLAKTWSLTSLLSKGSRQRFFLEPMADLQEVAF
ncbi:MAG: hypothetical protein ACUVR0_11105, partial [Candidatus Aminicenantales bacterium]